MNKRLNAITPLLRRDSLKPGESLPSFLERLRILNRYSTRRTIYTVWRKSLPSSVTNDTLDAPLRAASYTSLAKLCQVEPLTLYEATTHVFEPCVHTPGRNRTSVKLPPGKKYFTMKQAISLHHVRSNRRAAFCPLCLAEDPYHRKIWQPHVVTICLKHRCLLEETCPRCRSFQSVQNIVANKCACGQRLSGLPAIDLSGDEYGLLVAATLQIWLSVSDQTDVPLPGLPNAPMNILYHLLNGLRLSLLNRVHEIETTYLYQPHRVAFTLVKPGRVLSIPENNVLLSTAMKAVTNWPHGFFDFLDAYNTRKGELRDTTLQGGFGALYELWLHTAWKGEPFAFVREAFDKYLVSGRILAPSAIKSTHRDVMITDWGFITAQHAMKLLGIGQDTLQALVKSGTLHEHFPDGHRPFRYHLMFFREVEELKRQWNGGLTLAETATQLGLSETILAELARTGELTVLRRPLEGSASWLLDPTSVEDYAVRLLQNVTMLAPESEQGKRLIGLTRAAQMLGPVGGNVITILSSIAQGKLTAYMSENGLQGASSLLFERADVSGAAEQIKAENGWYDAADIAKLLHLKRTVIDKWIGNSLLTPIATPGLAHYFDRAAVEAFIADHVFTEEAAEIMGIGDVTVQRWIRGGRLKAVSGADIDGCHRWLLKRADVERLKPENRLTLPQAAKVMGVSDATLLKWVQEGKVKPVSGPGIDGMGQYLFLRPEIELGKGLNHNGLGE